MTAKIYEDFETRQIRLNHDGQARIIQQCYRSYKMLKNIKECTHAYRKIVEDCKKFEEERVDLHRFFLNSFFFFTSLLLVFKF